MGKHRQSPEVVVYLDGEIEQDVVVHSVERSVGATRADSATIELRNLKHRRDTVLRETELRELYDNKEVVITFSSAKGLGPPRMVHWGKIGANTFEINGRDGETILLHSRADKHLFGKQVEQIFGVARDPYVPADSPGFMWEPAEWDAPTVFNPVVDGIAIPNMWTSYDEKQRRRFVDPRAIRDEILVQDRLDAEQNGFVEGNDLGHVVTFWTLPHAVHYLCWFLNEDEKYVQNPSLEELTETLGTDNKLIRDLEIDTGQHLPDALDALLFPYGYRWQLDLVSLNVRKIVVYQRGAGVKTNLRLQQFGDKPLDTDKTSLERMSLNFDAVDRATNHVILLGDYAYKEVTLELRPAWLESYDPVTDTVTQLYKNSPGFEADPERQNAWRKFIVDTSGEWTGLRPWFERAYDVNQLFVDCLENSGPNDRVDPRLKNKWAFPRRRRFFPLITKHSEGASIGIHQGVFLQYWNPDAENWFPVVSVDLIQPGVPSGLNFQLLEEESGILFTDATPPFQLMRYSLSHGMDAIKLRITATFKSDRRIRGEVDMHDRSHLSPDDKPQVIEASRKYQFRDLHPDSYFYRRVIVHESLHADKTDGRPGLESTANDLAMKFNVASLDGPVTIEGIDHFESYRLGEVVQRIEGREVGFNTAVDQSFDDRFPTIVGITYRVQEQKTTLQLESFRHRIGL